MEKTVGNRKDKIVLILIILAGSVCIYIFMPWISQHPDACIHRKITGIGCPLCGMTHAVNELMHFRFSKAFQYNPAILFIVAWFGAECLLVINPSHVSRIIRNVALILLLASLGLVYAFRIAHVM